MEESLEEAKQGIGSCAYIVSSSFDILGIVVILTKT